MKRRKTFEPEIHPLARYMTGHDVCEHNCGHVGVYLFGDDGTSYVAEMSPEDARALADDINDSAAQAVSEVMEREDAPEARYAA